MRGRDESEIFSSESTQRERNAVSTSKPVVVYGASGYTGRLVCEYLREYNLPFIAVGRNAERVENAMKLVPGIETATYEVREVEHTVEALTELLQGVSVVCDTVGPFALYGAEVVEACLAAGVNYTDTNGEQDWMMRCDEQWGAAFASEGLLLAPGIAQMYTTGEIAANIALETPGLDTLDIAVFWKGSPTVASTETILVNAAQSKAHYLEQNEYAEWPDDHGLYSLAIPDSTSSRSPSRGAARRIRCGSSATRASPTARCSAASSTLR